MVQSIEWAKEVAFTILSYLLCVFGLLGAIEASWVNWINEKSLESKWNHN